MSSLHCNISRPILNAVLVRNEFFLIGQIDFLLTFTHLPLPFKKIENKYAV